MTDYPECIGLRPPVCMEPIGDRCAGAGEVWRLSAAPSEMVCEGLRPDHQLIQPSVRGSGGSSRPR